MITCSDVTNNTCKHLSTNILYKNACDKTSAKRTFCVSTHFKNLRDNKGSHLSHHREVSMPTTNDILGLIMGGGRGSKLNSVHVTFTGRPSQD
jgi:hypothetical protein